MGGNNVTQTFSLPYRRSPDLHGVAACTHADFAALPPGSPGRLKVAGTASGTPRATVTQTFSLPYRRSPDLHGVVTCATAIIRAALTLILVFLPAHSHGEPDFSLLSKPWFEARTAHFRTFSCGGTQDVAKLTARLEQFRSAYEALAGSQAVASPPIEVLALPDHSALEHFVPLYQGQPMNLSGFFHRGSDENLIVLSLADSGAGALDTIFHEYTHLVLRRNQQIWPMWLVEGMADIYATFEVTGDHAVRLGKPQQLYLRVLANQPMMPLPALFAVTHDSPEYNERDRQGIFYAESWLLTHYLMIGNPARRANFGQLSTLLRQGQTPEQAFTNAFHVPVGVVQKELSHYLEQAKFESLTFAVRASLLVAQPMATRPVAAVETCFRLGDELLRIGRDSEAESYLIQAAKLGPANPLASEGLGLLEAERGRHQEALDDLKRAIDHGSKSFLVHYGFAREKLILTAKTPDHYSRLEGDDARQVRDELQQALSLMPDFGPAHHLLGFFELIQGENLEDANQHLKKAIELEPENVAYLLTLAQVQIAERNAGAARGTLQQLCHPYIDGKLRAHAEEMLQSLGPSENAVK
ncbi:MAG TPA: tetratricopeptide repeat protein [Verrucomicrobiae bacterium]|nr:tetratricopeptide repeat protein [Verrucomicrobiae bacterium]